MVPQLRQTLLDRWANLPIERARPDRFSFLGIRTEVGDGYASFLIFADRDREPCLAAKVAREPGTVSRLQHEERMLNYFHRHLPERLRTSLPRPILHESFDSVFWLVTTAPAGQPIAAGVDRASEHFTRLADWLVQMAYATRISQPAAEVWRDLERSADQVCATFGLSGQEARVIEGWVAEWLQVIGEVEVGLVAVHGNLHRRHVWLQHRHLTIVDWERSQLAGIPLWDLFQFVTTYLFPVTRRGSLESYLRVFRATYLTDSPYVEQVCQAVAGSCRALDIPIGAVEPCFGLFLVHKALREYDRLLAAADRGFLPLLSHRKRSQKQPYQQAIKNQLWINLLRLLIKERAAFKLSSYPGMREYIYSMPAALKLPAEGYQG